MVQGPTPGQRELRAHFGPGETPSNPLAPGGMANRCRCLHPRCGRAAVATPLLGSFCSAPATPFPGLRLQFVPSPFSQEPHHRHDRRPAQLDHQGRREALQHERLGSGLLPDQRGRARHRPPRRQSQARTRSLQPRDGPERAGRGSAAAAPLLRHPALPDRGARGRVRERDQGIRLRGHLHHGLSGEGEPAAPRGAGDRGVRRPPRRGPRVRQQARAPGGAGAEREHQPSHRLQRLQGRGVHAAGPHGPEARPHRDDRAGAAQRAGGAAQGRRRDGRPAHGRRPDQARHRGVRPVGQERRRAVQVRARRRSS